ncbi:FtsX-like permease family protein [bacterium]|nr:FtsX-like permease family protein [bacterium]
MTIRQLVFREIGHRKLGFILGVLSVLIAVGVLVAELTLLDAHDVQTRNILAKKEAEMNGEMKRMEDDYRKITKDMGFNLLVLPRGQALGDFYSDGVSSADMPEEYVKRLADADIMTIRHILPSIEQKIRWPEQGNRSIILAGTRGEMPSSHLDSQTPILDAVPPGSIVLGYDLWKPQMIRPGDRIKLLGRVFTVGACHPERGTRDDITAWIDLAEAQELLNRPGRITGILALKCLCPGNDLATIRQDVARILPETQILEFESKSLARTRARDRAKATADSALAAESLYRAKLRGEREEFASWLIPLILLGCTAWIGLLAFGNVRERRVEIGILRALGFRSGQILSIFLIKAFLIGLTGGLLGYAAGYALGIATGDVAAKAADIERLFNPRLLLLVLVLAPFLTVAASWVPALLAARQDPATILREE